MPSSSPSSSKHRGLGRGLDDLIKGGIQKKPAAAPSPSKPAPSPAPAKGAAKPAPAASKPAPAAAPAPAPDAADAVRELDISKISPNPWQPRREFDPAALQELADSIKAQGLLQPVLVRAAKSGTYELVAGERRLRAAKQAGLKKIPALVRPATDLEMREMALVENLQRSDLNPIEEALAYRALADQAGLTQEQIAQRVGKARASVTNSLRLLDLSDTIRKAIASGTLSVGHAKVLLGADPELRDLLAARTVAQGLSVRALEKLVSGMDAAAKRVRRPTSRPAAAEDAKALQQLKFLSDRMQQELGTKVSLEPARALADGKREMGKIIIEWFDNEDLSRLLETLNLGDLL
ncbi:MAG: ParB/RepB/Spo0J family partition protein [Kiritimatiellae bacterium]|nr:ParB/RepB/Spo0J family partition protein [Kiritimatiellia bacterium]MBR4253254.1 ParB/RepB/Spo0J family partition protein [Kiritimatiellia bacterium]